MQEICHLPLLFLLLFVAKKLWNFGTPGTINFQLFSVSLGGGWDDVTDIADPGAADYRFFKATVTMP